MSQSSHAKTIETKIPTTIASEVDASGQTVDVLYQKMGNRWFAFSLIDDEVFVGSLSEDEIKAMAPAENHNGSLTDDGVTPASRRRRGTA